ncbi:BglG family transcription antiterminator [Gracilibacillus saliphilus]|uniref:BglG family transcription antiterminator n=1 Tax=Gracilibacillus saliphilus TaxID=543890 RepID=UPI0013D53A3D|nr:helix-turn-helix domain-containing protein [Gracilibacillus saliphilus]
MFSKRQKIILSYILYIDVPIKLDLLAGIIQVSIHTIRKELENINRILSESDTQVSISNKGQCYIENEKKEAVRNLLINPIFIDKNNIENHIVWDRIYTIIGMLSFEEDYVSMEELADRLFVSKSTINLDITEIKRIISRISGIHFTISNTKGLKFKGKEEDFRYLLAKMIVQGLNIETVLQNLFPTMDFEITIKYSHINKVLREIMIKHDFIISGKAFGLVGASLLISAIRDELGYIVHTQIDESLLPMMKELEQRFQKEVGITFTNSDMLYIQQVIMEQNHFYKNNNWDIKDRQIVSVFTRAISDLFKIDLKKYHHFEEDFLFYIHQLNQRVKNNHDYTNFYKRQINRMFQMSASIVAYCKPHLKELGVTYSEAELAYITLFLGNYIETEEPTLNILFVSDEHTALVNWIVSEVERLMGTSVQILNTIPRYLFEANMDAFLKNIDVILTTDQINVNHNCAVIFIQSLFGKVEQDFLQSLLQDYLKKSKMKKLREIENTAIGQEHFIQISEKYKELNQCVDHMLEKLGYLESIDNNEIDKHFIPNDTKIAYASFISNRPGQSKIIIGKLPKSITYGNKAIHTIIISLYHANDHAIARPFYQYIRFLMDPAHNNRIGKIKNYSDFKNILDR